MKRKTRNIAATVHQHMLNKAKETGRLFNEILQYFAIERFIYRLSKSPHANKFILKGALMFNVWNTPASRPTKDIDLLGKIDNSDKVILAAMKKACRQKVEPDAMSFDAKTIAATRIMEDATYEGIRVRIQGNLGNARISLQIDISFGDVIIPKSSKIKYPTILDFPHPEMDGYSTESTIAEKFQAMVKLGVLNSRMKDFYDIWLLSRQFDFRGLTLAKAIRTTFENRNTPIPVQPAVFQDSFAKDRTKESQWQAFLKKVKMDDAPNTFRKAAASITEFLSPVTASLTGKKAFRKKWISPGPWLSVSGSK